MSSSKTTTTTTTTTITTTTTTTVDTSTSTEPLTQTKTSLSGASSRKASTPAVHQHPTDDRLFDRAPPAKSARTSTSTSNSVHRHVQMPGPDEVVRGFYVVSGGKSPGIYFTEYILLSILFAF